MSNITFYKNNLKTRAYKIPISEVIDSFVNSSIYKLPYPFERKLLLFLMEKYNNDSYDMDWNEIYSYWYDNRDKLN